MTSGGQAAGHDHGDHEHGEHEPGDHHEHGHGEARHGQHHHDAPGGARRLAGALLHQHHHDHAGSVDDAVLADQAGRRAPAVSLAGLLLMMVLREYEDFYHSHRPHRAPNQAAIAATARSHHQLGPFPGSAA
jgi:hypothetical protein